ncbi:tyrosine-type recombinase/integrase [Pantoea rwandensis]|uniref:Recombinase XerD n=1 Tax=Pantoea rwandensis TaxID=1076550 RepID=A0ABM5RPG7_9GAMM|nr:tyrosine-type recombinase/integrase [Pantoea rwandensis]AIR87657.1 recombinase XerD [Pantoea rwandensis]
MKDAMTFEAILEDYFLNKFLREATEWSYRKVVKTFIEFNKGYILPESVTRTDVLKWRRYVLNDQGLSKRTWNNKVTHMRAIYNHAISNGMINIPDNPFNQVIVKPDIKRKKTLSGEQMKKIDLIMERKIELEDMGVNDPRPNALEPAWFWMTVIETLKYTGMRQNQLLHLRLCDIDLKLGIIELRAEGSKNHREHRVPVTARLRPRLEQLYHRAVQRGAKKGDQLFNINRFTQNKKRMTKAKNMDHPPLRAFFRRLSKECHCDVSPHRFRHTIATDLMKRPERSLNDVQMLLGHSSVAVTLEYVEANMDNLRRNLESAYAA